MDYPKNSCSESNRRNDVADPSRQNDLDKYRPKIQESILFIITSDKAPREVHQIYLDLAQFIEHCD